MLSYETLKILQAILHYGLHLLFPGLLAWYFFKKVWKKAWLIMIATMLVDLDHLLATPIFDPTRCSIGFHLLHSYIAIGIYFLFLFIPKTRIVAVGLLFHKVDQYVADELEELSQWESLYQKAGYETMRTSLESGEGMSKLEESMHDKVVLFSGHSGVGKSSLIQYFVPNRDIRVGDISDWSEKGQHTTTFAEVFPTSQGGWIIDTPGIKGFGLVDIPKEEIGRFFKEMFLLLPDCKFNTCQHIEEPGCAVRKAVESGELAPSRYHNYRSMLEDDKGKSPYR
jgi:ribosome biogenesis GTPase